jgi:hypothetical protein
MKEEYFCLTTTSYKVQDVEFTDKYIPKEVKANDLTKEIWMHGWLNFLTMLYIVEQCWQQ